MSSQAVYCLSLQIRPPADDNATDANSNNTSTSLDKMQSDSNELLNQHTGTATTSGQGTLHQTTTHRLTSQPTSNIYLVRGARTENGQIILQNSHDLLSLLNNDDDKPILLQHQRIKTENGPETSSASTILFQPALKATSLSDSPIILQTKTPNKKNTNDTPSTGQIFLQQRLNKNGTSDGPILLQTLKRLDKSQPILVFRSAASNNPTTTSTTTTSNLKLSSNNDDGDEYFRKEHNQQSQQKQGNIPLGSDGEPIKLPENLESLPRADHFPVQRHRWNTNEEIAAILISFDKHSEWQSKEVKTRPKSGSMLLYSRKKVRYRRDGYCWKKRKDGKTTREDHMKLKVQGTECIYGCYVHSAILPTFHRRCYWLLQNPDIVLVHYLNVPYPDDNKMAVIAPSLSLWGDKKEWTKEELVSQLKPMFFSEDEPDSNNEIEISTAETVEAIVAQLMEKQRLARQAALVKQLECGCPDSTCADGKSCSHPMRRITAAKNNNDNKRNDTVNQSSNQVTSTTPNVLIGQRIQSHGGLLILNGQQQSFVCQPPQHNINHAPIHHHQQQHHIQQLIQRRNSNTGNNKNEDSNKLLMSNNNNNQSSHLMAPLVVPKQEAMDSSSSSSDKQIDNVYDNMSYSSTQQNTPIDSPLKENNAKDYHDSLQFFNETLDLSQEDIQKTLSANMPIGSHHQHHHNPQQQMQHLQHNLNPINSQHLNDADQHNVDSRINDNRNGHHQHHDGTIGGDINPMDFIDHCDVVGVENVHGNDDDFVNLDAFDMLVEFPELELDGIKNGFLGQSTDSNDSHLKKTSDSAVNLQTTNEVFNISDYSPEWAYPEGGVKVLVTGPWNTESSYTVLFDSFPVPTTIVQSGVLRCYCPAHEVGLATLQVACDGYVISNSVIFEYKSPPKSESSELNTNEALFKFSLIDRFESINDRLKIKTEPGETSEEMALFNHSNFEDRMVSLCHALRNKSWRGQGATNSWTTTHRQMTLLHFASALGYSKLVCAMLTWRNENSNILLEAEIDALSQDCDGFTPLMWACAKGYTETAVMLYRWNSNALNVKNYFHQSPIEIASKNGYSELINEIEKLIQQKYNSNNNHNNNTNNVAISNTNPPPLTSLSSGKSNTNSIIFTTISNSIISSNTLTLSNQPIISSNNNFSYNNIANNNRNFYNINSSNNLSSVFTTVSSALTCLTSSNITNIKGSSINNIAKENSNRNVNLSPCSLPASIGSVNSMNSNRSHDGVFLRPGAVSSALSPPANNNSNSNSIAGNSRLSKRPSIDSGINIDIRSSTSALSRQSGGGNGNLNTTGEVSGDSSPIGNQQTTSDDDDDEHCCHQEGESDAKVLTLAEQIIAAMPERIKNESEELMSLGSPVTQETLSGDTSVISGLNDAFMEPLLDSISNSHFDQEFNFEFGDQNYRYHDVGTPCSSLSPASSGPLQSPASYSIPADPPMGSPSPPPTTQDFTEFLHASNSTLKPFEADFSNLTLTDREQRELYEAAKCIQKAYRSYKGRKKLEEQDKERTAAIVIQNYYRRYKQYAYYRQMTHAALVIQNKFRSYCEHKRFKKSQRQLELNNEDNRNQTSQTSSSTQFQNFYNNYQNEQNTPSGSSCSSGQTSTELSPSGPLKRTYSQRTQNQAARKIQQFMRQSKLKLQRERAEKERLVHQHRAEYLQSLQYQQGRQEAPSRDLSENIHQSLQQQQNYQNHQQMRYLPSTSAQIPTNLNIDDQNYWN